VSCDRWQDLKKNIFVKNAENGLFWIILLLIRLKDHFIVVTTTLLALAVVAHMAPILQLQLTTSTRTQPGRVICIA
jgi:hypothetical protein